jgi:hypothetical protein
MELDQQFPEHSLLKLLVSLLQVQVQPVPRLNHLLKATGR